MLMLIVVILGIAGYCFFKGYVFAAAFSLLGFSKKFGFVALTITSFYLFMKGEIIIGALPIALILWNYRGDRLLNYFSFKIAAREPMPEVVDRFNKELRILRVSLFEELVVEYSKEMDEELARFLAAQVTNYLQGEDIEKISIELSGDVRQGILKIKDQVEKRASELIRKDKEIRELFVYILRMKQICQSYTIGTEYFRSSECQRIDSILRLYGREYPLEANPKLFSGIVSHYFGNHTHKQN